MKKTLIVGVGNILRHDDGIGSAIIKYLLNKGEILSPCLEVFDAGTDSLNLLDAIERYDQAIIIDAVSMNALPGTVKIFMPHEAKIKIKSDVLYSQQSGIPASNVSNASKCSNNLENLNAKSISTHGIGLAEVLSLLDVLDIKTKVHIIGIQPQDISFGEGLSEIVKSKISEVVLKINELLNDFNIYNS